MNQLKELLESSSNFPKFDDASVGTIQLGSSELKKKIAGLRSQKEDNFLKAHYLLANSGISLEELEKEVKAVKVPAGTYDNSASLVAGSNGFSGYLEKSKDETVLAAIEQSLTSAARDFDKFLTDNLAMDWRKKRGEIYRSFGLNGPSSQDISAEKSTNGAKVGAEAQLANNWGKPSTGHMVLGPRNGGTAFIDLPKDSKLVDVNEVGEKFVKYYKLISELNDSRQQLKPFALASRFLQLTEKAWDSKTRVMSECWRILVHFVGEDKNVIVNEKHFLSEYLKPSRGSLGTRLVASSREYLEKQFLKHVDTFFQEKMSNADDTVAEASGLPTTLNKIKFYLQAKRKSLFEQDESHRNLLMVNDEPVWAIVYYLLRCGCTKAAAEYVQQNMQVFEKIDRGLLSCLAAYAENRVSVSLQQHMENEFGRMKNSNDVDPYKFAVYKVLGRCDLHRKSVPKILQTSEDWLWFNFALQGPGYTLLEFQKTVKQYGVKYFGATFANVLVLCGMYEMAVQQAFSAGELEAVHLAIGFSYYGLLRVSKLAEKTLVASSGGVDALNYAKLLGTFTRSFRVSDTKVALEYLLLIGMSSAPEAPDYTKLALDAIRELVVETREYSVLLGTINRDGSRYPGQIEKRSQLLCDSNQGSEYLSEIIEQAASRSEEDGRWNDALLLYQLAQNNAKVLEIINRLLGDVLGSSDISTKVSEDSGSPVAVGKQLMSAYAINPSIRGPGKEVLRKLLQIVEIRREFVDGHYSNCLRMIDELGLIPLQKTDMLTIRAMCDEVNLQRLDHNLMKNIGSLLLIAMHCVKMSSVVSGKEEYMVKQLMVFAGMMEYRMPKEVYLQIMKL